MNRQTTGIYHKFNVERVDGSSQPGMKHSGCKYFVLDLTHDKHAPAAMAAYADSCREKYPALADDCHAYASCSGHVSEIDSLRAQLKASQADVKLLREAIGEVMELAKEWSSCEISFAHPLAGAKERNAAIEAQEALESHINSALAATAPKEGE